MTTASTKADTTAAAPVESASVEQVNTSEALQSEALLKPTSWPSTLKVRWGLTVPLGNYSSARLDVEAAVPMDGSAESTLEELKEWVRSQSPFSEQRVREMFIERDRLDQDLRLLHENLVVAQQEYERFRTAFKHMGLEPGLPPKEDLPF